MKEQKEDLDTEKQGNQSSLEIALVKKGIEKNKNKQRQHWKKGKCNSLIVPSSSVLVSRQQSSQVLASPASHSMDSTSSREFQLSQEFQSLRKCFFSIERPIDLQQSYMFSGFVMIEIKESAPLTVLTVEQIEKRVGFYSALPYFQQISTEFDLAIHLLEHMQDIKQHEFAIMLRKYRPTVQKQTQLLKAIEAEFADEPLELKKLQIQRMEFRNKELNSIIANRLLTESQYFLCCDMGCHFECGNFTCPSSIKMSSSLFPIIGISEELINLFLLRKNIFPYIFPLNSRRNLSIAFLKLYSSEDPHESVVLKDFEIRTIDQISVICDATIIRLEVDFPKNLSFPNFPKFPIGLESIFIVELPLTPNHLDLVNNMRAQKQNCPTIIYEDFEYSVFSQMFMEKFYPEKLPQTQKQNNKDTACNNKDLDKTCNFKAIQYDPSQI